MNNGDWVWWVFGFLLFSVGACGVGSCVDENKVIQARIDFFAQPHKLHRFSVNHEREDKESASGGALFILGTGGGGYSSEKSSKIVHTVTFYWDSGNETYKRCTLPIADVEVQITEKAEPTVRLYVNEHGTRSGLEIERAVVSCKSEDWPLENNISDLK